MWRKILEWIGVSVAYLRYRSICQNMLREPTKNIWVAYLLIINFFSETLLQARWLILK
jgi:hypothetical protein